MRKIHTKLHPGLSWHIFHFLTSEDIDEFIDVKFVSYLYLNWLVYVRNIIRSPSDVVVVLRRFSEIFRNFWKMFSNVRVTFGQDLVNLQKCLESGKNFFENQKCCHQNV